MNPWDHEEIRDLIKLAIREDIGSGDITSAGCIDADRMAGGTFYARQAMVLAGIELLPLVYGMRGGVKELKLERRSGERLEDGEPVARVYGHARTLLECERICLNLLQRLSGIATLARRFADAVNGTQCRVLDTRKTTPGLRRLEKLAAAAGGVTNHRQGLYDAVLIKNNHIAAAGGVKAALARFQNTTASVKIEVQNRAEIEEALQAGATDLLLDNLSPTEASEEIRFIAGRATVELSGNINLQTVRSYAETGADFVSAGAITHSAQSVDLNFRLALR